MNERKKNVFLLENVSFEKVIEGRFLKEYSR